MTFTPLSIPNNEAQFLETRKFQVTEICRIFRVPPHMIGDLERATFSNIESQNISFAVHTIRPWLVRIEQAVNRALIPENEKGRFYAQFNIDGLMRGDYKSRMEGYAIARQNGWMSANDIRALENLNPISEEEGGDAYLVNGNMIPISLAGLGVLMGLDMVLRVAFAVLLSAALTSSSTPVSITDGLRTSLHPLSYLRIPVDEAASAISIAITLIPLISSESREIILASSARGIRVETEGKLKAKAHSLAPLVIPLFLAAFRKAENLGMAMEARGYSSGMRKSRRKNSVRIGRSEILFLILSFSIFISSLIIKEVL